MKSRSFIFGPKYDFDGNPEVYPKSAAGKRHTRADDLMQLGDIMSRNTSHECGDITELFKSVIRSMVPNAEPDYKCLKGLIKKCMNIFEVPIPDDKPRSNFLF